MNETDIPASSRKGAAATLIEPSAAPLWRIAGYSLLILALFDIIESFIPPQFMNPAWELQFMGTLIERSPVPLLGFLFVFFAAYLRRSRWDRWIAVSLSWFALACGIVLLLTVPLILSNTFRLERQTTAQVTAQLEQQLAQTHAIETALRSATGDNLEALLRKIGRTPEGITEEELRAVALEEVAMARQSLQNRADEAKTTQTRNLTKRSYKWSAQALVVGGFLIYLWTFTGSIRKGRRI